MDLVPAAVARRVRRLPRTRGDGPNDATIDELARRAPPHTRGWTHRSSARRLAGVGSPAHAGMDPYAACRRAGGRWLPRTRGDGPVSSPSKLYGASAPPHTRGWTRSGSRPPAPQAGSPAHAGMDPLSTRAAASSTGLPRTRGDGPITRSAARATRSAPPHTRGWTLRRERFAFAFRGSPAHAGMDPAQGPRPARRSRLPRTRGDGPGTDSD